MRYQPREAVASKLRVAGLVGVLEPDPCTVLHVPGGGTSNWQAVGRLIAPRHYWMWSVAAYCRGDAVVDLLDYLGEREIFAPSVVEYQRVVFLDVQVAPGADAPSIEIEPSDLANPRMVASVERNILFAVDSFVRLRGSSAF